VEVQSGGQVVALASVVDNRSGDPRTVPAVEERQVCLGCDGSGAADYLVAAVARAEGLEGSVWRTSAEIMNPFSAAQQLTLEYNPGQGALYSTTIEVLPGRQLQYRDLVGQLFPVAGEGVGSLHVRAVPLGAIVNTSTYNDSASGTYGQSIPALGPGDLLAPGETGQLLGLASTPELRTNIGFTELDGDATTVRLYLYEIPGGGGRPILLGSAEYELPPAGNLQISRVFDAFGVGGEVPAAMAWVRVESGGRVYAYASKVDNRTGDPTFVQAALLSSALAGPPVHAPILTASAAGQDRIDLSWGEVHRAASYRLTRGGDVAFEGEALQYSDTGLAAGIEQCYRVRAVNEFGNGPQSSIRCATTLPGECSFTISPAAATVGPAGGSGTVHVTASSTLCEWAAVSQVGWVQITGGTTGSGDGEVAWSVPRYDGLNRTGLVTIAQQTFTVTQTGAGTALDFTVSNLTPDIGESLTFSLTEPWTPLSWQLDGRSCDGSEGFIDCLWLGEACRTVTWSYVAAGPKTVTLVTEEGTRSKTVWVSDSGYCPGSCPASGPPEADFTIHPDPARVGQVVTFTDTSAGDPKVMALGFSWSPVSPEIGQLVEFSITGVASIDEATWDFGEEGCAGFERHQMCTPLFTDCLQWAHKFASAGSKTVTLTVDAGGTTMGPVTRTVDVQNVGSCSGGGGSCTYSISPGSRDLPAAGGSGSVSVSTQSDCSWTATSLNSWITVTAGASGVGSGTTRYTVDANPGSTRTGTVRVAGQSHRISQAGGGGCSYSISPSSRSFAADGGTGSVTVTTQAGCTWTAASQNTWITVTAGSSGDGPGTITYSVAPNTSANPRSGSLRIAGKIHSVQQDGMTTGTHPDSWSWTVRRDDVVVATSDLPSFTHVFDEPGTHLIELEVANCAGAGRTTRSLEVLPEAWILPSVVRAPGLHDTLWKTSVWVFNPGLEAVDIELSFLPEGTDNVNGVVYWLQFSLPPQGSRVFDDVVQAIPLVGDDNKGTLRLSFDGGDGSVPVVAGRTYNDTQDGTFGLALPAIPVVPVAGPLFLTGLADDLYYRSNVQLVNLSEEWAMVELVVLDDQGDPVGDVVLNQVPPLSSRTVVGVVDSAGVSADLHFFSVRVDAQGDDVVATATLVDNETGDAVL
jgi:PKD repeat protein